MLGLRVLGIYRNAANTNVFGELLCSLQCIQKKNGSQAITLNALVDCQTPQVDGRNRIPWQPSPQVLRKILEGKTTCR